MKLVSRFYRHKRRMRITSLHDDEFYQVTIQLHGGGLGLAIVPGHILKQKEFWKKKLACFPMVDLDHWTRRHNPIPKPKKKRQWKSVEVGFPWRNFKGRVMVAFVSPWSNSRPSWQARRDPAYAELVRKYMITHI